MLRKAATAGIIVACGSVGTAACVAVAAASLALGATAPVYDFHGGNSKFTSQIRPIGSKYQVGSVTLVCSKKSYVLATPKVLLSSSGSFSYSGTASLFNSTKKTKTTLRASGRINLSKKTGTAKASTTAKGCSSFSGTVKGFVVPIASP